MAGSGSYARGDQPRSVPDPLDQSYAAMERRQRDYNARQQAELAARKSKTADYWSSHPGTVESLVPVWGSAREAVADYRDGDRVGAAVNGVMAVTDLAGGTVLLKGVAKGGLKLAGSHTWKQTSKWMRPPRKGVKPGARPASDYPLQSGQHGHHWLIPQNEWGKNVPDVIKNQLWNIKAMPSEEVHTRMRGASNGKPAFNAAQRFWYGTPAWWKGGVGTIPGHVASGIEEGVNPAARDDLPRSTGIRR